MKDYSNHPAVWHEIDVGNSSENYVRCTALKNNIILNLEPTRDLYVFQSCSRVKISIRGTGTSGSESNVVILAADFVQFEDIATNIGLNVYSDAADTRVEIVQAPNVQESLKFSLSAPNTVDIKTRHSPALTCLSLGQNLSP